MQHAEMTQGMDDSTELSLSVAAIRPEGPADEWRRVTLNDMRTKFYTYRGCTVCVHDCWGNMLTL